MPPRSSSRRHAAIGVAAASCIISLAAAPAVNAAWTPATPAPDFGSPQAVTGGAGQAALVGLGGPGVQVATHRPGDAGWTAPADVLAAADPVLGRGGAVAYADADGKLVLTRVTADGRLVGGGTSTVDVGDDSTVYKAVVAADGSVAAAISITTTDDDDNSTTALRIIRRGPGEGDPVVDLGTVPDSLASDFTISAVAANRFVVLWQADLPETGTDDDPVFPPPELRAVTTSGDTANVATPQLVARAPAAGAQFSSFGAGQAGDAVVAAWSLQADDATSGITSTTIRAKRISLPADAGQGADLSKLPDDQTIDDADAIGVVATGARVLVTWNATADSDDPAATGAPLGGASVFDPAIVAPAAPQPCTPADASPAVALEAPLPTGGVGLLTGTSGPVGGSRLAAGSCDSTGAFGPTDRAPAIADTSELAGAADAEGTIVAAAGDDTDSSFGAEDVTKPSLGDPAVPSTVPPGTAFAAKVDAGDAWGLARLEWKVDGERIADERSEVAIPALSAGRHRVTVTAFDVAGNQSDERSATVTARAGAAPPPPPPAAPPAGPPDTGPTPPPTTDAPAAPRVKSARLKRERSRWTVRMRLARAAKVRVTLYRAPYLRRAGSSGGGRKLTCGAPRPATHAVAGRRGRVFADWRRGTVKFVFSPKLSRELSRRGRYVVRIQAIGEDPANRSRVFTLRRTVC